MIFDFSNTRSRLWLAQKHIKNIIEEIVSDKSKKLKTITSEDNSINNVSNMILSKS